MFRNLGGKDKGEIRKLKYGKKKGFGIFDSGDFEPKDYNISLNLNLTGSAVF